MACRPTLLVRDYSGSFAADCCHVLPVAATNSAFRFAEITGNLRATASRGVAQPGSASALGADPPGVFNPCCYRLSMSDSLEPPVVSKWSAAPAVGECPTHHPKQDVPRPRLAIRKGTRVPCRPVESATAVYRTFSKYLILAAVTNDSLQNYRLETTLAICIIIRVSGVQVPPPLPFRSFIILFLNEKMTFQSNQDDNYSHILIGTW